MSNFSIKFVVAGLGLGIAAVCIPAFTHLLFGAAFAMITIAIALHAAGKIL